MSLQSQPLQDFFRFRQLLKGILGFPEFARVEPAPCPVMVDRIAQVKHLVKQDVFERQRRHYRVVEDPADDDRVVRRIEVPQQAARRGPAPAELRFAHEPVKITVVQSIEKPVEVVVRAFRSGNEFAPADLPDQVLSND